LWRQPVNNLVPSRAVRVGLYLAAQLGYLAAGARVTLLPYSASKDPVGAPLGASRGNGYWGSTRYRTLNFASLASQIEGID